MTNVTPLRDGADDGWGTQADDYDIAEFYTKATDGRGHSDNMRVRVKPEIAGEIAAVVSSGRIPDYTTPQDFIRDAIVHRLRWLSEHADDQALAARLADKVRRAIVEERAAQHLAFIESFEGMMLRVHEVCEASLKWDDHHGVASFLTHAEEFAANSREPYAGMLRGVIADYAARLNLEDEIPAAVKVQDIEPDAPTTDATGEDFS